MSDIKFAQIENAPDRIFVSYIGHYLQMGGRELKTLCSASSTMSRRCNENKAIIQLYQPQALANKILQALMFDHGVVELDRLLYFVGNETTRILTSPNTHGEVQLLDRITRPATTIVKLQRICSLFPPSNWPEWYLQTFLFTMVHRHEPYFSGMYHSIEAEKDLIEKTRYVFSLPGSRERLLSYEPYLPKAIDEPTHQSVVKTNLAILDGATV